MEASRLHYEEEEELMIPLKHVAVALATVLSISMALAQSGETRPALPIGGAPVLAQGETPQAAELAKLQTEYFQARTAHFKPMMDARAQGQTTEIRLDPEKHPGREYHPRFRALAQKFGKTQDGFNAWVATVAAANESSDVKARDAAIEKILTDFIDAPYFANYFGRMPVPGTEVGVRGDEMAAKTEALIARVEKESTNPEVLASALARRVALLGGDAEKIAEINRQLVARYPETQAGKRAAAAIFEAESLVPGKVAPDFEATDVDGKTFRLSDYRGKVVVLEFWGFW
jgi:hypothetical protein